MKLTKQINYAPIPFECDGATWYMKKITMKDAKNLEKAFKEITDEDPSGLMILFTDVLVGEDGEKFEEIQDGITFEELCDILPVSTMHNLANCVSDVMTGQSEGN